MRLNKLFFISLFLLYSAGTLSAQKITTGRAATPAVATLPLLPNDTNYINNRDTLQSGSTFYVSSGTVGSFNVSSDLTVNGPTTLNDFLEVNGAGIFNGNYNVNGAFTVFDGSFGMIGTPSNFSINGWDLRTATATIQRRIDNLDISTRSITEGNATSYVSINGSTQTKTGGLNLSGTLNLGSHVNMTGSNKIFQLSNGTDGNYLKFDQEGFVTDGLSAVIRSRSGFGLDIIGQGDFIQTRQINFYAQQAIRFIIDNGVATFDSDGNATFGVAKKASQSPIFVGAVGTPVRFGHSNGADLAAPIVSQTLTPDLTIYGGGEPGFEPGDALFRTTATAVTFRSQEIFTSTINATNIYTNELKINGYPVYSSSIPFAFLNSTQTFSGQNTFLNQVTISSGLLITGNPGTSLMINDSSGNGFDFIAGTVAVMGKNSEFQLWDNTTSSAGIHFQTYYNSVTPSNGSAQRIYFRETGTDVGGMSIIYNGVNDSNGKPVFQGRSFNNLSQNKLYFLDHQSLLTGRIDMVIDRLSGFVGIGTDTVSSKLDVSDGSITVRGTNAGLSIAGIDVYPGWYNAINTATTSAVSLTSTQTFSGGNTFNQSSTFTYLTVIGTFSAQGAIDGGKAKPGFIGELLSSTTVSGNAITLTSGQSVDISSFTLSPGDWLLYGSIGFGGGAVTGTLFEGFFGTSAGNNTTGRNLAKNSISLPLSPTVNSDVIVPMPSNAVTITTNTTYFLKAVSTFSIGSATGYGTIEARRVR